MSQHDGKDENGLNISAVIDDIENALTIEPKDISPDPNLTKLKENKGPESESDLSGTETSSGRKRGGQTAAAKLLEIIEKKASFWFSHDNQVYATIPVGDWRDGDLVQGHWENVELESSRFEDFLVEEFFVSKGSSPGSQCITDTRRLCRVKARASGEIHATYIRVSYSTLTIHPVDSPSEFPYEKPDRHHLPDPCRASWKCGGELEC